MKKRITRIVVLVIAIAIVGAAISFAFVDRELSKMYGGHTEVAQIDLPNNGPSHFAIINVNVLTASADRFVDGQTVIIEGNKIVSIDSSAQLPEGAAVIDGMGRFLIPGFIDSHVHLWESENDLLLYIANGVTQIREMNGLPIHLRWKEQVRAGRLGPDMFVVAPQFATFGFLEGLFVGWTQHKTIVRSQSQVNKAVKDFADQGYDAVKASSFLDKPNYASLGAASLNNAIPLVGHRPLAVGLEDVWRSEQIEIAHIEELTKALRDEFGGYSDVNASEFLDFVRSRSDEVADRLLEHDISVTTTLSLIDSFPKQKSNLEAVLRDAELQYENPGISEGTVITSQGMGWLSEVNIYRWPSDWDAKKRAKSLIYWQAYSQAQHIVFDALLRKGVSIMAGTDSNVPVMVPGFSMHEEMKTMHESGMSPAQVIASATTIPARFLKTDTGEIRPGFIANLVLLRENPLNDIDATRSIDMVIINGRMLSRNDLNSILSVVETANDNSRGVPLPRHQ